MEACQQTEGQSVLQHGFSVKEKTFNLIKFLQTDQLIGEWRLPDWIVKYKQHILNSLLPFNIIEEYTIYHDCGKPFCHFIDENGKRHFPNHSELSYQTWLEVGGSEEAALLMKMDMDIHLLQNKDIKEFCQRSQAITLLLVGLAEIHSNAAMFGGLNSTSFKIKYKKINKRGTAICKELFGEI